MASITVTVPAGVITALRAELGDSAEGLTPRAVFIAWLKPQLLTLSRAYRRRAARIPLGLETARIAAETALLAEKTALQTAESTADAAAVADIGGVS